MSGLTRLFAAAVWWRADRHPDLDRDLDRFLRRCRGSARWGKRARPNRRQRPAGPAAAAADRRRGRRDRRVPAPGSRAARPAGDAGGRHVAGDATCRRCGRPPRRLGAPAVATARPGRRSSRSSPSATRLSNTFSSTSIRANSASGLRGWGVKSPRPTPNWANICTQVFDHQVSALASKPGESAAAPEVEDSPLPEDQPERAADDGRRVDGTAQQRRRHPPGDGP